jgi:hypothetical protein
VDSLDWADVTRASGRDLLSVIIYGVERELCEGAVLVNLGASQEVVENAKRHHQVRTVVLGHFRWMTYGGVPEFCCLSTAKVESILTGIRPDTREPETVGAGALKQQPIRIASLNELADYCLTMRASCHDDLSVPLLVNLDLIASVLSKGPDDQARQKLVGFIEKSFPDIH